MELKTTYLVSTPERVGNAWVARVLLLASILLVVPVAKIDDVRAAAPLLTMVLGVMAASLFSVAAIASPVRGKVTIDADAFTFDRTVVDRESIVAAYYSPGAGRRGPGITLLDADHRERGWIGVANRAAGRKFLDYLGLGLKKHAVRFEVPPTSLGLASLCVGADGLGYGTAADPKFLAWSEVESVERSKRGVSLSLTNGDELELPLVVRRIRGEAARLKQAAVVAVIQEALLAARDAPDPGMTSALARQGRTHADWVEALTHRESSFREAPLQSEDLWRIVESAKGDVTARAGAAALLAQDASDDDLARLRIAADTCAEPKLRVVLDQAARGEDAISALADVEDDALKAARLRS